MQINNKAKAKIKQRNLLQFFEKPSNMSNHYSMQRTT